MSIFNRKRKIKAEEQVILLQRQLDAIKSALNTGLTAKKQRGNSPGMVHVIVGSGKNSRAIIGVYFDEVDADNSAADNDGLWAEINIEHWCVQGAYVANTINSVNVSDLALTYCAGQLVKYQDEQTGKSGIGTIISDDDDGSCPCEKIIYGVVPSGLSLSQENEIHLFGYEIKGLI